MLIDFIIEDLMLNSYLQKNFHTLIGYDIVYIYLLSSEWFDSPKYQDYYDYMDKLNCPHYFDVLPLSAIGL